MRVPSTVLCRRACAAILGLSVLALDAGAVGRADASRANIDEERSRADATRVSRQWLQARGVRDEAVRLSRVWVDGRGTGHTRWRQMYGGVPVWAGEGILHTQGQGVYDLTNGFVGGLRVDTTPSIDAARAREIAIASQSCPNCEIAVAAEDIWVARMAGADRLVRRVVLAISGRGDTPEQKVVFVDAHTGDVVWAYDNLKTGTGPSLYRGTIAVPTLTVGATRYMEDTVSRVGTFDFRNGTSSAYRFTDADDVWDATNQRAALDAHAASVAVMNYLRATFGRIGVDANWGPGVVQAANGTVALQFVGVHYGSNYNNAFWDGQKIVIGDGDGSTFGPLVSLDIIAHEWFHGITQYSAGLIYSGESGALNESFSDVFGAMVERYAKGESANTWKIGEEAYTPNIPGDALRYLNNPRLAYNSGYTADDQPDYYAERYTGAQDNGGVHINSGIPNHVFYLAAAGGTHRRGGGTIIGIGADATARIWYRALTTYLTSSSDFAAARTATLNAARDLYGTGSAQQMAVQNAWCLVGIGTCATNLTSGDLLLNGGFESAITPWVIAGTGVTWSASGGVPKAGASNVLMGGTNTSGTVAQDVTIPVGRTPSLQAFVAIVTNDTSGVVHDRFTIEVRNTGGILLQTLATFSNVNRNAGTYERRGTYSLAAYAGQRVRIVFRAITDGTIPTTFRLDEVSLK